MVLTLPTLSKFPWPQTQVSRVLVCHSIHYSTLAVMAYLSITVCLGWVPEFQNMQQFTLPSGLAVLLGKNYTSVVERLQIFTLARCLYLCYSKRSLLQNLGRLCWSVYCTCIFFLYDNLPQIENKCRCLKNKTARAKLHHILLLSQWSGRKD